MQEDNIEYLSGEVKEILASPPTWVSTWGTCVLLAAVALIVLVGFKFHFPEIVSGDVVVTTETPPVSVFSPKSEYISEIQVKENSEVKSGDLMLVFPSNASYSDVLELDKDLENIGQLDLEKLRNYKPNRDLKIGELSQAYSSFIASFEMVPLTESGNIDLATVVAVDNINAQFQNQLKSLQASLPSLQAEESALKTELKSAAYQYGETIDTSYTLVIYNINTELKNKQSEIKKVAAKIEEIKGEISKSNMRKYQAQTQAETGASEAIIQLNRTLDELKKEVKLWKETFIVTAPVDGTVQFYSDLKVGQFVNGGDILFTILPKNAGNNYVGKVKLPVDKSSKVKSGQAVNIKFGRYPFREYGTVRSTVSKVYPVAKDNAFYADLLIENGLVTTLNRKLDFYQQMAGKAEIVTEDKTFIKKLFEKFTAAF